MNVSHKKSTFLGSPCFRSAAAIFIFLCILLAGASQAAADDIPISNCTDLRNTNSNLSGSYVLTGNIDCTGVSFSPLGTFTGTLNGAGHAIENVTTTSFPNSAGIYNALDGATVKDLTLTNITVTGNYQEGLLAADGNNGTTITDVNASGNIGSGAALSIAGGIVGGLNGSTITNSSANVTFSGVYELVGGLVGIGNSGSTISKSYSTGSINATAIGGDSYDGGLAGQLAGGSTISNSYSTVSVTANGRHVGGLTGEITGTSTAVSTSYSTGAISDNATSVGGFIGDFMNGATTTSSYWDVTTSGTSTSQGGGTGTTTAAMKTQGTFAGWDFSGTWQILGGAYPTLLPYSGTITQYSAPLGGCGTLFTKVGGTTYATRCGVTTVYSVDSTPSVPAAASVSGGGSSAPAAAASSSVTASTSTVTSAGVSTFVSFPATTSQPIQTFVLSPFPQPSASTSQPVATSSYQFLKNLSVGSQGADVLKLQQILQAQGLLAVAPNGYFGQRTRQAVITFQKEHGIKPASGNAGPLTRTALSSMTP